MFPDNGEAPTVSRESPTQALDLHPRAEEFRRNQELIDQQRKDIQLLKQRTLEY